MRNKLLVSVAMTALIGSTALAVAQNAPPETGTQPGAAQHAQPGAAPQHTQPGAAQPHQTGPGGAMNHAQPGGQMAPGGAAQNEPPKSQLEQKQSQSQAQPNQGMSQTQPKPQSEERGQGTAQERGQGPAQERGQGTAQERGQGTAPGATTTGRAGGGANVQLSQDQRTKIKDIVVKDRNVARIPSAEFNVRVGVAVPRTVHVAALPPEVVTLVPEYRGFEYVIVGEQLLIIDPNTMEIVAILPA
jgi:Protein of unknown function (DUF1236)